MEKNTVSYKRISTPSFLCNKIYFYCLVDWRTLICPMQSLEGDSPVTTRIRHLIRIHFYVMPNSNPVHCCHFEKGLCKVFQFLLNSELTLNLFASADHVIISLIHVHPKAIFGASVVKMDCAK